MIAYNTIKVFSAIIRFFVIPNPFGHMEYGFAYNLILEPILHLATFTIAGLYYRKGINSPTMGSSLYLFFYWVHTCLIILMEYFDWNRVIIAIIVLVYLGVNISIRRTKDRMLFY